VLISTLYWSMLLINIIAFVMLALWLRPFAMIVKIPHRILAVAVIVVSLVGIYAVNTRLFDCGVALAAGVMGYMLLRLGWPLVALIMGIVMGPIVEERLRETLSLGEGSLMILLERPITVSIIVLAALILIAPPARRRWLRRKRHQAAG